LFHLLVFFLEVVTDAVDLAKFHHEDDGLTFGISGSSGVTRFRGVQEDL
jgi:hypothetical protein